MGQEELLNTELPHYRTLIESALVYAGGTHTFEDVVREVEAGTAQFWPGPTSCIVTQLETYPSKKVVVVFLAAGDTNELKGMAPLIEQWAIEEGCTAAKLIGRKGWLRSWVMEQGWQDTELVTLEKPLYGR